MCQTGKGLTLEYVCVLAAERLRVPPGPAGGGRHAGRVLHHGPAVVRGGDGALHLPRQQPEGGVGLRGARRAAQVPGHQGAEGDRLHDLRPHGLLRLHDVCAEGQRLTGSGTNELYFEGE